MKQIDQFNTQSCVRLERAAEKEQGDAGESNLWASWGAAAAGAVC